MFVVIFDWACKFPNKNENQNDSIPSSAIQNAADSGGNLVKSEAPDATTRMTQGYGLPRHDYRHAQSPINILSDSTVKDSTPFVSIKFNAGITAVENLGHTIQLDFKEGSTALAGGKTYSTRQFHFHTPSEHMIDGMTFPMEMHIVNVMNDSNAKNNPQYLVVAFLFKMGRENKFIKEFLKEIPREEKKDSLPAGTVNFEDLFNSIPKNESDRYYSYKGSATTPPYSETADWIIKKYILEASPEQIYTVEKIEGDNARHVQALYTRKVFEH